MKNERRHHLDGQDSWQTSKNATNVQQVWGPSEGTKDIQDRMFPQHTACRDMRQCRRRDERHRAPDVVEYTETLSTAGRQYFVVDTYLHF